MLKYSYYRIPTTAKKFDLQKNNPQLLEEFRVHAADREFQFWERNPLNIELYSEKVYFQKVNYIHYNPVEARLCVMPEYYFFSSARFYETLIDGFVFLTHLRE